MQQGGSQFGLPPQEMTPFVISGAAATRPQMLGIPEPTPQQQLAEAASPIRSRLPEISRQSNIEELTQAVAGNYTDDLEANAAGEETERGMVGNRWPRPETLALLRIRSEMDAAFRDATLKGPLWDEVSRKLAEEGYNRSAKKCKEKFENVHKYYKRTKEKCGGRQDGRSYRFFSQLEALSNLTSSASTTAAAGSSLQSPTAGSGYSIVGSRVQPAPLTSINPPTSTAPLAAPDRTVGAATGISSTAGFFSFSSNTSTDRSSSDSDGEDTDEALVEEGHRKRKRERSRGGVGSRKMRCFFKGLMQQVLERQEAMQKKFLETIEKRDQDRMIREEAWKRQEMSRLNREHELMAQERAASASRDASIIAFLQKITGQSVPIPQQPPSINVIASQQPMVALAPLQSQRQPAVTATPSASQQQKQPQQKIQQRTETPRPPSRTATSNLVVTVHDQSQELGSPVGGASTEPASSRWPKQEVLALINIRSDMEPRYQENGPKGPLWEEISATMQRQGYNRNPKRCKEKWENINKYYKKVKESSKKRPEDSKTCPYFHQLDALYRKKNLGGAASGQSTQQEHINPEAVPVTTLPPPTTQQAQAAHGYSGSNSGNGNGENSEAVSGTMQQTKTSNGGRPQNLFEGGGTSASGDITKPEDKLMVRNYHTMEENDNDSIETDEEEDELQKMAYKIEFQRSNVGSSSNKGGNPTVTATTTASSFLAMVQ